VEKKKKSLRRKIVHAGGWQIVRKTAKSIPVAGTLLAAGLVGSDIRRKGFFKGLLNSGLDAVPFVGFAKNAYEIMQGDIISDKKQKKKCKSKVK
jgi:hypothetical protein